MVGNPRVWVLPLIRTRGTKADWLSTELSLGLTYTAVPAVITP